MKTINRSDLHLHYKADTGLTVDEELYNMLPDSDTGYIEWLEEKLINLARAMEDPSAKYKVQLEIEKQRLVDLLERTPELAGLQKVYDNKHLYLLRKKNEK